MITINDILNSVVSGIAPTKPSGYNVAYYPGKPILDQLQKDLVNNISHVSVFPYNMNRRIPAYILNKNQTVLSVSGVTALYTQEKGRQQRGIQIQVWSNDPTTRDLIGEALKEYLDENFFISIPLNQTTWVKWMNEIEDDTNQAAGVYLRNYIYIAEYPTIKEGSGTIVVTPQVLNNQSEVCPPNSVLVTEIIEG